MSESPLVSIIIPAFNAEAVIAETLDSVRAQTFRDFEALIVDDGSTDNTAALAKSFCEGDSRFRLISAPHLGLPRARNAAIGQARGRLIAFLDADDIWFPEKLARQTALFHARSEVGLSFSSYYFWDGTRNLHLRSYSDELMSNKNVLPRMISRNTWGVSTVMVRAKLLQNFEWFDPAFDSCEDWDLWLRMVERGLVVAGIREPLGRYRRWPGNLTKRRMTMAETRVAVLEKNLRLSRHPEMRPHYERSLAVARAKLELIRACASLETQPKAVPGMIWRAWRFQPKQKKWLGWFLLLSWPKSLGGSVAERIVRRKLLKRYDSIAAS